MPPQKKFTPPKKLFQKIIFSQFQFRLNKKKLKKNCPLPQKNFPAKKINFSQIQFSFKNNKIYLKNFKKNSPPSKFNFVNPNGNSWVDSRRSACTMGKWGPSSAHAYHIKILTSLKIEGKFLIWWLLFTSGVSIMKKNSVKLKSCDCTVVAHTK